MTEKKFGGAIHRHPIGMSANPPPYLGITSSRYVSSLVLAEGNDQKKYQLIGGTSFKNLTRKLVEVFVLGRRRKKANIYKHPPPI